jgi:hypothetical protein
MFAADINVMGDDVRELGDEKVSRIAHWEERFAIRVAERAGIFRIDDDWLCCCVTTAEQSKRK